MNMNLKNKIHSLKEAFEEINELLPDDEFRKGYRKAIKHLIINLEKLKKRSE